MFQSARLKLTLWYLAIIMTVSVSFSVFIYRIVSVEFERRIGAIESRLELRKYGFPPPPRENVLYFIEDINQSRKRVLAILLNTNLLVLLFSAIAGYFLAGKTLKPIEKALDDQKRFVADASHELKTPITGLKTSIEVGLRDKNLTLKDAKILLRESLVDIENLQKLIDGLLTLARISGQKKVGTQHTNLREVITETIKNYLPFIKTKKIKVTQQVENVKVCVEKRDIEQVVGILIDNAIKYSNQNSEIKVNAKKSCRNLVIVVDDQGVGINDEDVPKIFDRFYRIDSSRSKTDVVGFGLGLSIAKEVVDKYGGVINVKSQFGKGSQFTVIFPLP